MPNYTNSIWTETTSDKQYPRLAGDVEADVAVIGAGITGVTAAYLLKLAGFRVALVESRRVGKGDTGKTTAHLTEVMDTRYHQLISRFGVAGARLACRGQRAAIERIRRLVEQLKIDCQLESVPGYLYAESAEGLTTLDREQEAVRKVGLAATVANDLPLPFPVVRALRFDDQAQLDARRYLLALAARVEGDGCHVFEQTHVTGVDVAEAKKGGDKEPSVVKTDAGTIRARDVVVATHVPIVDTLTIPTKVAAYRSYVVGVTLPDGGPRGLFWDVADPYHYIRCHVVDGRSTLIVGGEDHKVGEQDDTALPFQRLEAYVLNHFHRPVAATDHRWSGQVLEPVDGLPYIGRTSADGHLYVATGYSGNGITSGTLAAMIITDQIRGVDNVYGDLFDPSRVKPLASATAFVSENVDFPKHLIADHLPQLRKSELDVVDSLPMGEGVVARVEGKKLAIYRNGRGELSALSPVCTHLGCLVHWNTTEKSWDCPCHGSRFDPTGRVLNGPATAGLEAKALPEDLKGDLNGDLKGDEVHPERRHG